MSRQNLSTALYVFAIAMLVGAAVTLVPHNSLQLSDLGYHTLCPFAPWSTLTLVVLAGLGWLVHRHIDNLPE
jgi:hypothetical protein